MPKDLTSALLLMNLLSVMLNELMKASMTPPFDPPLAEKVLLEILKMDLNE